MFKLKLALITFAAVLPFVTIASAYTPPASPRVIYNFNPGWKFIREDVTNAEQVAFDDSKWSDISTPHTYNDVDSYTVIISHSGGDRGAWSGITSLLASAAILSAGGEELTMWPKLPEPTAVGAVRSAIAVHVTSWRWLGFCRRRHCA